MNNWVIETQDHYQLMVFQGALKENCPSLPCRPTQTSGRFPHIEHYVEIRRIVIREIFYTRSIHIKQSTKY